MAKGSILYEEGKYKEAIGVFRKILKLNKRAPLDVHFAIGLCQLKLRNNSQAEKIFRLILERDPHHEDAFTAITIL